MDKVLVSIVGRQHCDKCGNDFRFYRADLEADKTLKCPGCGSSMLPCQDCKSVNKFAGNGDECFGCQEKWVATLEIYLPRDRFDHIRREFKRLELLEQTIENNSETRYEYNKVLDWLSAQVYDEDPTIE